MHTRYGGCGIYIFSVLQTNQPFSQCQNGGRHPCTPVLHIGKSKNECQYQCQIISWVYGRPRNRTWVSSEVDISENPQRSVLTTILVTLVQAYSVEEESENAHQVSIVLLGKQVNPPHPHRKLKVAPSKSLHLPALKGDGTWLSAASQFKLLPGKKRKGHIRSLRYPTCLHRKTSHPEPKPSSP
jgi:hypothetical protein